MVERHQFQIFEDAEDYFWEVLRVAGPGQAN